jgi:ABC-type glycerol-3-phosphate transport system substrate-binding protein
MKKIVTLLLLITIPMGLLLTQPKQVSASHTSYEQSIFNLQEVTSSVTYGTYKENHPKVYPNQSIQVDLDVFTYTGGLVEEEAPYLSYFMDDLGESNLGIYIPESGDITFYVNVPTTGYYQMGVKYFSIQGRSSTIQKGIKINGEYPFIEAESISLLRFFKDAYPVSQDREPGKSDVRPKQIETHLWTEDTFKDRVGYYNEAYYFHFQQGNNTITLTSKREPVVIGGMKLFQAPQLKSYDEYYLNLSQQGVIVQDNHYTIEAEEANLKSSPSLNPIAEYSTMKFSPYESFITRYNAIGGNNWRIAGDEITWRVQVNQSGFYKITFKAMQNFSNGQSSTRTLKINGEVPFKEALQLEFKYNSNLQYVTLGNQKSPMYVYLVAGQNEITLQANIGTYGDIVQRVNVLIQSFRTFYREVVMRTGLNPDPYQDYLLNRYIHNFNQRLVHFEDELKAIKSEIIQISGGRSSLISPFDRTLNQVKKFMSDEKNVQNGLREFEQNISALGAWVISISEQPLTLDQIIISGDSYKLPNIKVNIFEKIWHEITLFFGSFMDDSDLGSGVSVDGPTIEVWIGTGRDQTTLLRQLIDESFTTQEGINVKLKMVNMGVLLQATLSGNGPDVAIGVDQKMPVNWGIRNAIVDLTTFNDFEEVKNRFSPSALEALSFNGRTYALPDTEDFLVMFYRKDILENIGVNQIPQTWDEVIDISPILQKRYLEFYVPVSQGSLSTVLYAMMRQNGGQLYINGGEASGMLHKQNIDAFLRFTRLFSDYGFALEANFANRFRSGEMPIGIANYSLYNTLSVFAPEIAGQWDYALIPGVYREGVLHQETTSTVSSTVIMSASKQKEASWTFMKWWLSKDTQVDYARGMEAIIGSAARYPTANLEAFEQLPWPIKDYLMLKLQREKAVGIPTVPGDYIVGRHIDNAFRAVLNSNVSPQDALYHYHLKINEEITRKRNELGL